MTERRAILSGSPFEEHIGYARAVMIECGLADPRMKIEIEVTARRSR